MQFHPNVNLLKVFSSEVMLINDQENAENGLCLIQPDGDGPLIHAHPFQEEYFRVIEGKLEIYNKDRWYKVVAGEEMFIPKNTAHSFRSRDTTECLFEYSLTPKGNFSDMLKTIEKLMQNGNLNSTSDLKSLIYLSMVMNKYSNEMRSVKPPHFFISALSGIGSMLQYKL